MARVTVCSGCVSSRSAASAIARPSASPVISTALASARYSRRRDSDICSSVAPIGASTAATRPATTPIAPRPPSRSSLPPPKIVIRISRSEASAITPTSTAARLISRTSRFRMCDTSCASTPSSSRLSIILARPVVTAT